jgi:hypothetical protein
MRKRADMTYWSYYVNICMEELMKITKNSVKRRDDPAEIQTGNLPNTFARCSIVSVKIQH